MLMKRDASDDVLNFNDARNVTKTIKQEGGKFVIYSEDGGKTLGSYDTKDEAVERLRQIEGHKNKRLDDARNALVAAVNSINDDPDVVDKLAKISESIDQFNAYIQQETADMTPEETNKAIETAVGKAIEPLRVEISKRDDEIATLKMSDKAKAYHDALPNDETKKNFRTKTAAEQEAEVEKVAKKDKGETAIDKALDVLKNENAELRKHMGALLSDRRTAEFKKRAIDVGLREEDGDVMLKAFDGDVEAQSELQKCFTETLKAAKAQAKTGVIFGEFGKGGQDRPASAYQEIEAKAAELRKLDPKLSKEQAFTKAFTDPANAEIVARDQQEQSNRLLKLAATGQS